MDGRISTLLAAVLTAACASSGPATTQPAAETVSPVSISARHGGLADAELHNAPTAVARTVAASPDAVWRALPTVYERLGISEPGADSTQWAFGNQTFRPRRIEGERLSRFLDCGRGFTAAPRADEYEITLSVVTRLAPGEQGGTRIETTVVGSGKPRAVSGNPVHCRSLGTLEARIAELVAEVLRVVR
jgi:hypothetical protein